MGVAGWTIGYLAVGIAAFTALVISRMDFGRRFGSGVRPPPENDEIALDDAPVYKEPGPDIHLVMNIFNRLAGQPHFEESETDPQIFGLSDYLRHCLIHTAPVHIGLAEELALLGSYVRLVGGFRAWELEVPVQLEIETPAPLFQAHSICLIAQALFCGFSAETPGRWTMPVKIGSLHGKGIDIDMALRALSPQRPVRLRSIHYEMQALCNGMSRQAVKWCYSLVRNGDADIAINVHIDRREYSARTALQLA